MMKTHSYYLLALISAFAVLVRLIAIPILGNGLNLADIYYVDREAAKLVLELRDPYLYSNYTNHYGQIVTFAYLPLIPIYYAPFVLIHLDVRYGSIAADVASIVAMYFIAKSTLSKVEERSLIPFSGIIAYAVLPTSIWLTSGAGTNMMIGSMFLVVALATLLEGSARFRESFLVSHWLQTNL